MQAQRIRARNHYDILVGEGFRGTKRDRPTDRSLPPSIKKQVKESAIYNDLQRMERTWTGHWHESVQSSWTRWAGPLK